MADSSDNQRADANPLLKRNAHLRDSQTSSPVAGFGPLGTRQFLQKQLMTPGSATSASSFEEGASFDGLSDAGTPASEDGQHSSLYVTRTASKQPTKRLSSPSRESLARRLMGSSAKTHGMLPDAESASKVDVMQSSLPPSDMLSNLVVKPVPAALSVREASTSTVTRRIVASPRKTLRRLVVRTTGADGQVHEEVQYVDADGQVVQQGGNFFNPTGLETDEVSTSGRTTVKRQISTPSKTMRRVVVRTKGADGQMQEQVQYVDADGNVVQGDAAGASSSMSSTISTPSRSTITRHIVTPAKLTRRIVRRTGADGQVHQLVQFLDADGNVVRTEGEDAAASDSTSGRSGAVVTRRTVTPGKTIRRVIVRRTGADGQMHEEVQFMDADGNVVQSDGSELVKPSSFSSVSGSDAPGSNSGRTTVTRRVVSPGQTLKRVLIRRRGADGKVREEVQYLDADGNVVSTEGGDLSKSGSSTTEETITHDDSSDTPGRRKVTRRVIRRMLVRKDGTRVPIEQYVDSDGQVIEGEGGTLFSAGSFTGSVSSVTSETSTGTPSRRTITRRVVSSPGKVVRRTVAHNAGSSSGAESEEEQYLVSEGGDLASSGSFTRTVTSQSTPGRRVITRRVVTPQRVIRRMVVRKGTAGSSAEADANDLDIDAEFVQSEDSVSSDESVGGSSRGGSSRGGYSVSNRIVIPRSETRRVVSRTTVSSNQPQDVDTVIADADISPSKTIVTSGSTTNQTEVMTPTRVGVTAVTEPQEGASSPEATQKIGLTPGVIWDYFTKSENEEKPAASSEEVIESSQKAAPLEDEEIKVSIPTSEVVARTSTTIETAAGPRTEVVEEEKEAAKVIAVATAATATAIAASTIIDESTTPDQEIEVAAPLEGEFTVSLVDEPIKTPADAVAALEEESEQPRVGGGFWNFFGKSEDNTIDSPSSDDEEPATSEKSEEDKLALKSEESVDVPAAVAAAQFSDEAQQHLSDAEDDEFMTPQASYSIDGVPETEEKTPIPAGIVDATYVTSPSEPKAPSDANTLTTTENAVVSPADASASPNESATVSDVSEEPRHSGGAGFWGLFGKSEEVPKEPSHSDEAAPVSSEIASVATIGEESVKLVVNTTYDIPVRPSSDNEIRGFEAQQQTPDGSDGSVDETDGSATVVVPVPVEGVASPSFVEEDVAAVEDPLTSDADAPKSPRGDVVLPAVVGATATAVTAMDFTSSMSERQQRDEATSDEVDVAVPAGADVVVTTTTKTEEVEEESRGGFWGFFGKQEPKNSHTSEAAPTEERPDEVRNVVEADDDTAPATIMPSEDALASPSTTVTTSHAISEAQQELLESPGSEVERPAIATFYEVSASDDTEKVKAPVPSVEVGSGDIIDVPEPHTKTELVASSVSSTSPQHRDALRVAGAVAAAGVATAVVANTLDTKEPDTDPAVPHPTTGSENMPSGEVALGPVGVSASSVPHPIETTTTVTTEESESPSKLPHRKPGRSIWKFWGGDKPKSPLSDDENTKEDEQHGAANITAPISTTMVPNEEQPSTAEPSGHTPVPSTGEARQFWHQQDQQNPNQISFAAAEGATYGPESKFESMPSTDKIRSPVARGQRAVVDSPRNMEVGQRNTGTLAGGFVVTEVTQTTIEVEEEFESEHLHHDAPAVGAATIADITVVSESQQPVERESIEREEPKDAKPARVGGFWGFLGKNDKPKRPAAAVVGVGGFDNSGVERVSWDIEGDEGKLQPDSTKHGEDAAAAVVQIESIRRSIPSDGAPPTAAGPVATSGKPVRDSERRTTELIDGVEPDIELDEHYVEIASPRHNHEVIDGGLWTVKPCSLAWSNLRLNRKNWKDAPADAAISGGNTVVLNDVSGSMKAGEFLVITGPSKGESLALLSCLAGYEDAMEGNVTVNGREWNEKMNRYVAYVMREDLFYETLTVHEHLVIQAHLRMRRTHTDEMCLERVERVIEDMGLSGCRDKLIGGGISLRGITRGERKLLAIATALLTNPSILLLEEPTDSLDTFSSEKIVAKLRWLAFEKGLTVVVTLHHPSSHFYGLFDVLYLVAHASCVYDGKAANCVAYFSTIGFQCPEYMSPMDYFMLQMVVGDRESDDEGVARVETLKREWAGRNAAAYAENAARAAAASEDAVVDDYDQRNGYYHMGCCGQLWLLWARHVRRLSRYGFVFWWHLVAALLIGVVFGLVYLQLDLNDQQGIQNFAGAFFYAVVVQMLFIAYRTFVFMPRETAIALRERQEYRGGWYHLICWYFTKIVAELPALIVLSIALFVPVFLLVGIGHGFKVYVYMQIVMVLAGWAAISLAFLTLGVLRHVTLALIVYAVLLVFFVAFGGLLINVTDIPDWLVWLHYISPVKYAYEAMMKIFWKRVDTIDCDWTLEGCVALTGDGVLKYYSMENRSALGDSLILLAICFALFFVAFWFLQALASKRISGLQWRYDWTFKGKLGNSQQRVGKAVMGEKYAVTRSSMQRVIERKSQHSSSAAVERSAVDQSDNFYIRVETPRVGVHGLCDAPGITLGWNSLWLKAPTGKKTKVDNEPQHQQYLLNDASGSTKCGELVIITGPSDEANVALLESLGGLQKRLKGKVTLNGVVSAARKVSQRAAYVARDDLFYETLTVEEHLRFQAQLVVGKSGGGCGLCCGSSAGDLEAERVEMVLDELELTSKRHVLIRYLSAADTKLLAVATALLSNPCILLVEEPTCGMDFYSSQRVVLKLRQLARGGRTVVVTMAHPSSHLYALFDTLYLLAGGAAVYHGKVREAVPYFASLGYQCPQYMSPVDYFVRQVSVRDNGNEMADGQATLFKEAWSTRYSELCLADNSDDTDAQGAAASRRRIGCCGQISLLFRRHLLRLARYRVVFGWHAFWMIVLGVIFGLIFLHLDLDNQQDIQNWAGAFFFLIVLQMLVIAYRTFVFLPREMTIAEREHRSGGYYMICWYLTKIFAELPAMLVLSVLLFVPAYVLIGIGHGFKLYIYMQIVMWLAGWSAVGMASLLLGLFSRVRVALIVYMLLLLLFVVFGGLLVNVDDVPDYLIWLHYISPVKYGYEALMKLFWGRIIFLACGDSDGSGSGSNTFAAVGDDYSFSMSGSGSFEDGDGCIAHSGDEVLSHYSMEGSRDARSDSIILLELTVLYFFIGYAFLSLRWRQYKTRQQRLSVQNPIDK